MANNNGNEKDENALIAERRRKLGELREEGIAYPNVLQGRYLKKEIPYQIVQPKDVIDTLMTTIFRIRSVLDSIIILVGSATFLALVLVFSLSLRLREREIDVIFKLGCNRATITRLHVGTAGSIHMRHGMCINYCNNRHL